MASKPQGGEAVNPRWLSYSLPAMAGCVGIVLCISILHSKTQQHLSHLPPSSSPQCAHWAVFRTAQLLGIPMAPGEAQRLLPNQPQGHTMAQVVETLAKIGLQAEGYRDDWDSLTKQICHLRRLMQYVPSWDYRKLLSDPVDVRLFVERNGMGWDGTPCTVLSDQR